MGTFDVYESQADTIAHLQPNCKAHLKFYNVSNDASTHDVVTSTFRKN